MSEILLLKNVLFLNWWKVIKLPITECYVYYNYIILSSYDLEFLKIFKKFNN